MSQDSQRQATVEQPATIRQLREKLPDASADFILRCAEEGWTIRQATDRFIDHAAPNARIVIVRSPRSRPRMLNSKNVLRVAAGDTADGSHNQSLPNPLNTKRRPTT